MRILIRPRLPVLALLLLAPSIPELLTGSTPVSNIVWNPAGFLVGFPLDIALYGAGALLIREFAVAYHKGWGSILLLGAAYGVAEEGFEIHTFFQPSGSPVDALGSYGHLFGVDWLWALGLMLFHATYSIALPILLTQLWFPGVKDARWLDRGAIEFLATLFVLEVVGFGFVVGHGPSLPVLAFFVAVVVALMALAAWLPENALRPRPGPRRIGPYALAALGSVEYGVWVTVLAISNSQAIPAVGAGLLLVLANAGVLVLLLRRVGTIDFERSEFLFAVGMLSALFVWDILIEFVLVPGILGVTAVFVYLLYRLDRTLKRRSLPATVSAGTWGSPPAGSA